jgi:hypothetical protein
MATTAVFNTMRKLIFFLETTGLIESKLYMDGQWMVSEIADIF